jgi:hypothetical protein
MFVEFNKHIKTFKGRCVSNKFVKPISTAIAFDLDETLGSFADLELLWTSIHKFNPDTSISFNSLMDLYPEFLRYGIVSILDYLYSKKQQHLCDNIYIYTNNQCNKEWVKTIADYFDYKIGATTPIFDKIIHAFKINDEVIEISRTTHEKTYADFIKCTLLPEKTRVCFIDNSYFPQMKNSRVYYIQPKSYVHSLTTSEIIDRFSRSRINTIHTQGFNDFLYSQFKTRGFIVEPFSNKHMDIYISQKIMYHIKEFFFLCQRKKRTRKNKCVSSKFTRKQLS